MRLVGTFSPSHEILKNEFLLPTLQDDYEVCLFPCHVRGEGRYLEADWTEAVLFKADTIIRAIKESPGGMFVYADMDVVFLAATRTALLESLRDADIACQLDDPQGNLCTGFFAIRANDRTLKLWQQVRECVTRERRDQPAFNRLVRLTEGLRCAYLPTSFFGTGTFTGRSHRPGERFHIPARAAMFHANWTVGVDNKIALLAEARRIAERSRWGRQLNNLVVALQRRATSRAVERLVRRPPRVAPARTRRESR